MPRLVLITHGSTDAVRHARFPRDEPLAERGRREISRIDRIVTDRIVTAPELRTVSTAEALGFEAVVDPDLRDIDYAKWRGSTMEELPETDVLHWLSAPDAAPHGGESLTALLARVGSWLSSFPEGPDRVAAVTHPAIVRAVIVHALAAPPSSFWRIDVPPASVTTVHGTAGRWTLRLG